MTHPTVGNRPGAKTQPFVIYPYFGVSKSSYAIVVSYNAPHRDASRLDTPRRFLHLDIFGGHLTPELRSTLLLGIRSGQRPLQQPLGIRRLGGHLGRLYLGLPDTQGGGELGCHLTFIWHQNGLAYALSLHSWLPRSQTLAVLNALIRHLR